MAVIAIEWTGDRVRWTSDGQRTHTTASLKTFVENVHEPSTILCEPSSYGHDRSEREWLRGTLALNGHTLAVMDPGAASVLEAASAGAATGSGVRRLRSIAIEGSARLDCQTTAGRDCRDVRQALDVAHALTTRASKGRCAGLAAFPRYEELEAELQLALGDGSDYYVGLTIAITSRPWSPRAAATSSASSG